MGIDMYPIFESFRKLGVKVFPKLDLDRACEPKTFKMP